MVQKYFMTTCAVVLVTVAYSSETTQASQTKVPKPKIQSASTMHSGYLPSPDRKYPEKVLWGDQHVHTGWSADAGLAGTTLNPDDAVRFALGEEVTNSSGLKMRLHRALDWVAVTDHSDAMGTMNQLVAGNSEFMADETANRWYDMMQEGGDQAVKAKLEAISSQANKTLPSVFLDPKWTKTAWQDNVDIMEKHYKPGRFTPFISYEWTSNGEVGQNLHRNVIFRDNSDKTRDIMPLTTFVSSVPGRAGTDPESLWNWLDQWESKTGGRVLAIPHNGNMSNGWMFRLARYDGTDLTPKWAQDRQRWERAFEIYQYKGSSEAHPTLAKNDEFANFGIWDTADLNGNPKPPGAIKTEYWRDALKNGMALEQSLGTNPFVFGAVSGTDTHTGLTTGGEEDNYGGSSPANEPSADRWSGFFKQEGSYTRKDWTLMAQGVTGVWATSNTRPDIWDAIYRRETYASSGPRISVRFFGGFSFDETDANHNLVATGYNQGVPMGGDLEFGSDVKAPTFIFSAEKDPEGANLDRFQIIKGWVDTEGETHEKIYDVAWDSKRSLNDKGELEGVGNTVDLKTAEYTNSIGAAQLTGFFQDPEFSPDEKAFYYARVIEIPTPRWTLYDTVRYGVNMNNEVPLVHQERVVTSPIWYHPK